MSCLNLTVFFLNHSPTIPFVLLDFIISLKTPCLLTPHNSLNFLIFPTSRGLLGASTYQDLFLLWSFIYIVTLAKLEGKYVQFCYSILPKDQWTFIFSSISFRLYRLKDLILIISYTTPHHFVFTFLPSRQFNNPSHLNMSSRYLTPECKQEITSHVTSS